MNKKTNVISIIALTGLFFVQGVSAETTLARINGKKITKESLKELQKKAPSDQLRKAPFEAVFRSLRDQKIAELLITQEKSKKDMANDAEVLKLLGEAKEAIELQVFLKREIEQRVTDRKLKDLYAELTQKMKNQKEFEVGIILVQKEKDAQKALNDLNAGKPFKEVAEEYSIEPNSKQNGGSVGYVIESAISAALGPDVANALKILKDNVHSKTIIKTKDGKFLLVRRGATRAVTVQPFDQIKPQLKSLYAQKALMEFVDEIAKKSDLKVFDLDGKEETFKLISSPQEK